MPSRHHHTSEEQVYQQVLKSDLFVVFEKLSLTQVSNVFITRDQIRELYDDQCVGSGTEANRYFRVQGNNGQTAYIDAQELINRAQTGLEKGKFWLFSQPVEPCDWVFGIAYQNAYLAQFGLKYLNAKGQFIKAPTPKIKGCPKPIITCLKKSIIESGRVTIQKMTGASITFGAADAGEVDGSAYLIKKFGVKYKDCTFHNGWLSSGAPDYIRTEKPRSTFNQRVDELSHELTPAQKKELLAAIADWWKNLGPLKAE